MDETRTRQECRCQICGTWKPWDFKHFSRMGDKPRYYCKDCATVLTVAQNEGGVEAVRRLREKLRASWDYQPMRVQKRAAQSDDLSGYEEVEAVEARGVVALLVKTEQRMMERSTEALAAQRGAFEQEIEDAQQETLAALDSTRRRLHAAETSINVLQLRCRVLELEIEKLKGGN